MKQIAPPAKARSLLLQYQLRTDDTGLDQRVLQTLYQAKFSVDNKRLSFGVESPLIRSHSAVAAAIGEQANVH